RIDDKQERPFGQVCSVLKMSFRDSPTDLRCHCHGLGAAAFPDFVQVQGHVLLLGFRDGHQWSWQHLRASCLRVRPIASTRGQLPQQQRNEIRKCVFQTHSYLPYFYYARVKEIISTRLSRLIHKDGLEAALL